MQGTQVDGVDIAWGAREYTGRGPRVVPADHRPWSHSRPRSFYIRALPVCAMAGLAWPRPLCRLPCPHGSCVIILSTGITGFYLGYF